MELRHLRYFVAVAEEENITRAAVRLHVSQPGLSRQVRDLENELGFALLERGARTVRLTEAGRVFASEARAVLERAEQGIKTARALAIGGMTGDIQIAYSPSLTVQILPKAMRQFQNACPRVRVHLYDLSTEEMVAQLLEGKLDLTLGVQPCGKALRSLRFVELAQYPLCLAVAPTHPLANGSKVNVAELPSESLIGYSRKEYPEYHDQIEALFRAHARTLRIASEHESVMSLMAEVETGHGVALVPSCLAALAGHRLKLLPLNPPGAPVVVGATVRAGTTTAAVEEFIAAALKVNKKVF
jgi:DNA-binding transcriptional LysR family regulator